MGKVRFWSQLQASVSSSFGKHLYSLICFWGSNCERNSTVFSLILFCCSRYVDVLFWWAIYPVDIFYFIFRQIFSYHKKKKLHIFSHPRLEIKYQRAFQGWNNQFGEWKLNIIDNSLDGQATSVAASFDFLFLCLFAVYTRRCSLMSLQ